MDLLCGYLAGFIPGSLPFVCLAAYSGLKQRDGGQWADPWPTESPPRPGGGTGRGSADLYDMAFSRQVQETVVTVLQKPHGRAWNLQEEEFSR